MFLFTITCLKIKVVKFIVTLSINPFIFNINIIASISVQTFPLNRSKGLEVFLRRESY